MAFQTITIDRHQSLSKKAFVKNYYRPQKPVVIEKLTQNWPAYQRWSLDYMQTTAADVLVPLYNNDPVDHSKKVNEPIVRMPMSEYIDLLKKGPTELRIFLFNLIKAAPHLKQDFEFPDLGLRLLKSLPMLFFGGQNSSVFMHYDIDLANIFHFHFSGKKHCMIVPYDQSAFIYKIPFSTICREDINFESPDFVKWPGLQNITPYTTELSHGEMLYIPEGWWHHMTYLTPGFSMSLRSIATKPSHMISAFNNIFVYRHIDNVMRKILGPKWLAYKDQKAITQTDGLALK